MRITARLFLLALLVAAVPLAAQTHDWSQPGSSGVVAPPGLFSNAFTGPTLRFGTFSTGTVLARYQITNTYGSGVSKTPAWTTLWATYTDNSASGSVTTKLYAVDKCTGTYSEVCSISSSDGVGAQCNSCTFSSSTFDFSTKSYWVEVTLTRSVTSAAAEIHSVAVN